ncbi:hypothetical protein ACIBCM_32355 [Streptomyces sp. NPDC051018]|uniref:hypothetical protein n=1 Tax=Streptomyces sp. NPDC051018 TaxID=3365639 RepID=UPI0037AD2611
MTDREKLSGRTPGAGETGELVALLRRGGFWGIAPEWVPRGGYAEATPEILAAVAAGLRRWRA